MKDLFALLLGGDLFSQNPNSSLSYPKDDDPNWSKVVESAETKSHIIKKEIWTSKDGSVKLERFTTEIKRKENVDILKKKLKRAVDSEDYEQAAKLRDKIKMLES
jgi:excinuclease UvrABC helicase subunit UvrB